MKVDDIKRICVVGAGTMGSQIAQQCALHGYQVNLSDVSEDLLAKAAASNRGHLTRRVAKGKMTEADMEAALARVRPVADLKKAAGDADFVFEAVFENLQVKRDLFAKLDDICPPHTILASNSSMIIISLIAEAIKRKDKAVNTHFFHPVLVLELVEVVKGKWTSDETAQVTYDLCKRIGRTPILLTREIYGFIVNRILRAQQREAYWLADNGYATPEDIDIAVRLGLAHPMGPFQLSDNSGLDVGYMVWQGEYERSGDPKDKPPKILEDLVKAGHLGKKTGKGFYEYEKPNS